MKAERWQNVTRLFEEALELDPDSREHRLLTETDPEIVAEVRRLLRNHAEVSAGFLSPPGAVLELRRDRTLVAEGDVLCGRYQIVRAVGVGGMGRVYEALDLTLHSTIALKIMTDTGGRDVSAWRRAVLLPRSVSHPGICKIYDLATHQRNGDTLPLLTMEFLHGETLSARLAREGKLSWPAFRPLFHQLVGALAAAHSAGILHRDLKPANIMLPPSGDARRLVIMDFGLAAPANDVGDASWTEHPAGTLRYMAPEHIKGHSSTRSDVYAVGLIAFESLTGQSPFSGETGLEAFANRIGATPPRLARWAPEIPAPVAALVERCLHADARMRFATGAELAAALDDVEIPRPWRPSRRAVFTALSVGVGIAGWKYASPLIISGNLRAAPGTALLATPLVNATGDADLDVYKSIFERQLQQSRHFRLLDRNRLGELLQRMNTPAGADQSPELVREAALRDNVPFVLFATLENAGAAFALHLNFEKIGPSSPSPVAARRVTFTAPSGPSIATAIHSGALWLRDQIGESAEDRRDLDRLPEEVTTRSWEALLDYARGERELKQEQPEKAILAFKEAVARDPEFALAWMRIGDVCFSRTRQAEGLVAWKKAIDLLPARRLTKVEEFRIRGNYYSDIGDYAKSVEVFEAYASYYPYDRIPLKFRAMPLLRLGRVQESLQVLIDADRMTPGTSSVLLDLALHHAAANQFDKAREALENARKVNPRWAGRVGSIVAFVAGDYDNVELELDRAELNAEWPWRSVIAGMRAYFKSERGEWANAAALLEQTIAEDDRKGLLGEKWSKTVSLAALRFRLGDRGAARRLLASPAQTPMDFEQHRAAISILARNGAVDEAERWLQKFPVLADVPRVQWNLSVARGEVHLAAGRSALGEQHMRAAAKWMPPNWPREQLAYALTRTGKFAEATAVLAESIPQKGVVMHARVLPPPGFWGDMLQSIVLLAAANTEKAGYWQSELRRLRGQTDGQERGQ